ncbi:MAG: hypothetical protein JW809_12860 [Pirellulales bacterium]|nr:hypothetical protein [Pirellulales bacterium]
MVAAPRAISDRHGIPTTRKLLCAGVMAVASVVAWAGHGACAEPAAAGSAPAAKQAEPRPALSPQDVYRRLLKSTAWLRYVVEGEGSHEGTGWVVDAKKRLLVTNEHVVTGVDEIEVYFPATKNGKAVIEGCSTTARLVSLFVDITELRDYLAETAPLVSPKTAKAEKLAEE